MTAITRLKLYNASFTIYNIAIRTCILLFPHQVHRFIVKRLISVLYRRRCGTDISPLNLRDPGFAPRRRCNVIVNNNHYSFSHLVTR